MMNIRKLVPPQLTMVVYRGHKIYPLIYANPRGLAQYGVITGWVMTTGLPAAPGILTRTDAMDAAQWFVLIALFAGGLGWNVLYTIWCIGLGRLLLTNS